MADETTSWSARLRAYRPVLDRAIFAFALLGVLVAVHLWIQQGRGFDRGCLGFSEPVPAATVDCNAVVQSRAGTVLGVSNAVWGILFYLVLTAVAMGAAFARGQARQRIKGIRAGLIGLGFLYTVYLLYYQSFVVGQYCVLCLISAAIVAVLFGLQAADLFTESDSTTMKSSQQQTVSRGREVAIMSSLVLLVFVLSGADILYFRSLDGSPAQPEVAAPVAGEQQRTGQQQRPAASAVCRYDAEKGPIENYEELVQFTDPIKGAHDAPVTVIEYLDPNCPHCEALHPVMQQVIQENKDQARFVYKLFPLSRSSIPQVLALHVAAENQKFFEMLNEQFEREGVLSVSQLRSIASEIGMDPDAMVKRMQSQSLAKNMMSQRQKAHKLGVNSTPTVIINGRVVASRSRTEECLNQLIDEAAENAQG